jgi:N-methylhydantoinase A/oxoprolinase/acetone carboxylase beta subunit
MLIRIDIGGTFTDIIIAHGEELTVLKIPLQQELEEGVREGLRALEFDPERVERYELRSDSRGHVRKHYGLDPEAIA